MKNTLEHTRYSKFRSAKVKRLREIDRLIKNKINQGNEMPGQIQTDLILGLEPFTEEEMYSQAQKNRDFQINQIIQQTRSMNSIEIKRMPFQTESIVNQPESNSSDSELEKKELRDKEDILKNFRKKGITSLNQLIELRKNNQLFYPVLQSDLEIKNQSQNQNKKNRLDDWNFGRDQEVKQSINIIKKQLDQQIIETNKILDQEPCKIIEKQEQLSMIKSLAGVSKLLEQNYNEQKEREKKKVVKMPELFTFKRTLSPNKSWQLSPTPINKKSQSQNKFISDLNQSKKKFEKPVFHSAQPQQNSLKSPQSNSSEYSQIKIINQNNVQTPTLQNQGYINRNLLIQKNIENYFTCKASATKNKQLQGNIQRTAVKNMNSSKRIKTNPDYSDCQNSDFQTVNTQESYYTQEKDFIETNTAPRRQSENTFNNLKFGQNLKPLNLSKCKDEIKFIKKSQAKKCYYYQPYKKNQMGQDDDQSKESESCGIKTLSTKDKINRLLSSTQLPKFLQNYRDIYLKYLQKNYVPSEEDNLVYQNHASLLKLYDDQKLDCKGDIRSVKLFKNNKPIYIVPFAKLFIQNSNKLDLMKDKQSFSSQKKMKETYQLLDQIQILQDKNDLLLESQYIPNQTIM